MLINNIIIFTEQLLDEIIKWNKLIKPKSYKKIYKQCFTFLCNKSICLYIYLTTFD
jgi:hypothetical protein